MMSFCPSWMKGPLSAEIWQIVIGELLEDLGVGAAFVEAKAEPPHAARTSDTAPIALIAVALRLIETPSRLASRPTGVPFPG
jgi:hypothetical protein